MKITLKVWRQADKNANGYFEEHVMDNVNPNMSLLELMDTLNNTIIAKGGDQQPVAFDSDCREGICGMCSMVINGRAHGPLGETTTCQLYMRNFSDGDVLYLEPFRATAFPVIRDLCTDRSAFDKIVQSGGYITANVGGAPDANLIPIPKKIADYAMDAAQCIGCGACVAACKNSSAMLFVSAKVSHLSLLPQGNAERHSRVRNMIAAMDTLGFGNCTNEAECEAECPKGIKITNIARLNREFIASKLSFEEV